MTVLKNNSPQFTVVIPTFNRANDLRRALQTVCDQTCTDWEVIVVDNHSDDDTERVIKDFSDPRIKFYKIHNYGVIAASRNLGIEKSLGKYIAFLDSDDWWLPDKLQQCLDAINSGADVIYHDLFYVKRPNQFFFLRKVKSWALPNPVFESLLVGGNALPNSSVVIKKHLLQIINGLREDACLAGAEDYQCWLSVAKITNNFTRLQKPLGFYWAGGGNYTNFKRTLQNIDSIEIMFKEEIAGLRVQKNLWWMDYARGLSYYHTGQYFIAQKYLRSISLANAPLSIYLKSQFLSLGIEFLRIKSIFWRQ
jgi:glycosyltransferase involved in cell wall biosynthesis